MSAFLTPAENHVTADRIEAMRAGRVRTNFEGCTQVYQLFLKADGKLSCSCMRYWDILADAKEVNVADFFHGPIMRYIRESFSEGYEPFDFCHGCPSRQSHLDPQLDYIDLHIEPSNQCNLYCEACLCTVERLSSNPPPRVTLDYAVYERMLADLKAAGLPVRTIALVGFGEPLFNSRTPEMARLGRTLFPDANIFVDTNANFGEKRAEELADCGLSSIRLALDGVDQDSYEAYRRSGEFDRAIKFTRRLVEAIGQTNSGTKAVWKYILFRHNDSDAQLRKAVALAKEIGLSIVFDGTVGANASVRPAAEIQAATGQLVGCNIDPRATKGELLPVGVPEEGSPLWRRLFRPRQRANRTAAS